MYVCFSTLFCSNDYLFTAVPHYPYYCTFTINLPTLFSFKILLGTLGCLHFHINIRISLVNFYPPKKCPLEFSWDFFELWCWRRLLRVPWTARRSNQSILKEISPGCSLEGLMLKLKLQYFGHLMWRVNSLEKTLMLGGIGGRRRRRWQRMRLLDGITNSMGMSLTPGVGDGHGGLACCDSWIHKESDMTKRLNWTEQIEHWKNILAILNLLIYEHGTFLQLFVSSLISFLIPLGFVL